MVNTFYFVHLTKNDTGLDPVLLAAISSRCLVPFMEDDRECGPRINRYMSIS